MIKARNFFLFLFALVSSLWGQVAVPRIGFTSDMTGALRPLLGVAGTFLWGDPVAQGVLSSGYSGTFAFFKSDQALSIISAGVETDFPCTAGPALFSFSGNAGFAFFLSDGTLHRWDGTQLATVALDTFDGQVLALAQPDANHVWLAVEQNGQQVNLLRFDGITGALESSAPLTNAGANLALLNDREFLFTNDEGLVLHLDNGIELPLAAQLKGEVTFERLAQSWWSVKDASGHHFALRLDRGHEAIYQLPENQ